MGLDDEARRIARGQSAAELAAQQAKAAQTRQQAQIHPWRIDIDGSARSLAAEFTTAAARLLKPVVCMTFKGGPRPSHDRTYSRGERVGRSGWCIFPTQEGGGPDGISMSAQQILFVVTANHELILTSGLVEKDAYTNTGFMGPRIVASLPTGHNNPYHGKRIGAATPIEAAHARHREGTGYGESWNIPPSIYTTRTLREILGYNLAALRRKKHPQQTGDWRRFTARPTSL
jgi:hypothetical protein